MDEGKLKLWDWNSPLSYDKKCQFGYDCAPQMQKNWRCVGCQSLSQLFSFQTETPQIFSWDCGPEAGDPVHIEKHVLGALISKMNPISYKFDTDSYQYRASDGFTQRILSSWCVQDIMQDQGMENYQPLYTAHACGKTGYLLTRHVSTHKDVKDAKAFFQGLFSIFKLLDSVEYSFSYPKADDFGWIDNTLVFRVGNGSLTRITDKGTIRLYDIDEECNHKYYHQYVREDFVTKYDYDEEFYHLSGDSVRQILESQRAGFRFVGSCLDIYAILLDWMSVASVKQYVLTEAIDWWKGLWTETEEREVLYQLQQRIPPLEILEGKSIRPQVLSYSSSYFSKREKA